MSYRSMFMATGAMLLFAGCNGSTGSAATQQQPIAVEKPKIPDFIAQAMTDPEGRPWTDYRRDAVTKYAESYAFAQIKPGDKVVELYAADGSNIKNISRIVGPKGHVYGITFMRDLDQAWELRDKQEKAEGGWKQIQIDEGIEMENASIYHNVSYMWTAANQFGGNIALPEQVDVIYNDHYHDNHDLHTGWLDMVAVNKSLFRGTKPGGIYMVMDSVAADGRGMLDAPRLHRTEPKALAAEITAAGFVLEAEDDTWRRTDDTHTGTAQCEHCRDMSDRFAYRFRKPLTAAGDMRPKDADPMAGYYGNTLVTDMGYRDIHPGSFERHRMYNKDGTFAEYGYDEPTDRDPVPMRLGTWFWDASGHNCERVEYPARERDLIVCNDYIKPRGFNKVDEVKYSGGSAGPGTNPTPVEGENRRGWAPANSPGHVTLVQGHSYLELPFALTVPAQNPVPPPTKDD